MWRLVVRETPLEAATFELHFLDTFDVEHSLQTIQNDRKTLVYPFCYESKTKGVPKDFCASRKLFAQLSHPAALMDAWRELQSCGYNCLTHCCLSQFSDIIDCWTCKAAQSALSFS